jgi:hypothetical protein
MSMAFRLAPPWKHQVTHPGRTYRWQRLPDRFDVAAHWTLGRTERRGMSSPGLDAVAVETAPAAGRLVVPLDVPMPVERHTWSDVAARAQRWSGSLFQTAPGASRG